MLKPKIFFKEYGQLIAEGDLKKLYNVIREGRSEGMQTFNQVMLDLYQGGHITRDEAVAAANRPEELLLELRTAGLS